MPLGTSILVDLNDELGSTPGGAVLVTGIGWDVIIDAVGFSFTNEATIGFRNSSGDLLLQLIPGNGAPDDNTVDAFASGGLINIAALSLDFMLGDGLLELVFYEQFLDAAGVGDTEAIWLTDSLVTIEAFSVVPAPGTFLLLVAGLGGLIVRRRRQG